MHTMVRVMEADGNIMIDVFVKSEVIVGKHLICGRLYQEHIPLYV